MFSLRIDQEDQPEVTLTLVDRLHILPFRFKSLVSITSMSFRDGVLGTVIDTLDQFFTNHNYNQEQENYNQYLEKHPSARKQVGLSRAAYNCYTTELSQGVRMLDQVLSRVQFILVRLVLSQKYICTFFGIS